MLLFILAFAMKVVFGSSSRSLKNSSLQFCLLIFFFMKVECETEDNVRVDAVGHLSFQIKRPDGTLQSTAVYRKPIQNEAGTVTVQPIAGRHLEESGVWSIVCQYTEYRERLKCVLPLEDHVTKSQPLQFVVNAGRYFK